jgi:hypothetical protein
MSMNLPAAEAAEVRAKYGPVFTAVQQVVVAGSIDEEDNFFEAEADGEGFDIDEVSSPSHHSLVFGSAHQRDAQAAVMRIVASFEAPIELLSVNKRTATEIKFEVQNTAAGRKAAFILGFKGGDVGGSLRFCVFVFFLLIFRLVKLFLQKSAARTRQFSSRVMTSSSLQSLSRMLET